MKTATMKSTRAWLIAALLCLATGAGAEVIHNSPYITGHEVWSAVDNDHIIVGNAVIAAGGSLTIEPGCVVRIEDGVYFSIYGTLTANGASGNEILFTRRDTGDSWYGLHFYQNSTGDLSYATVEHASKHYAAGVHADRCWVALDNCTLRDNSLGLRVDGMAVPALSTPNTFTDNLVMGIGFYDCSGVSLSNQTVTGHDTDGGAMVFNGCGAFHLGSGNVVTGNYWGLTIDIESYPDAASAGNIPAAGNTNDGILVEASSGYDVATWYDLGVDFVIESSVTVQTTGALIIADNATVRAESGGVLHVYGVLATLGTAGGGVLLTRNDPDDEWLGIWTYSGAVCSLQYTTIEYCTGYSGAAIHADGAWPTLANCTFRYNNYGAYGIYLTDPTLSEPNTFSDNLQAGIYFTESSGVSVSNQTITGHGTTDGAMLFHNCGAFHLGDGNTVTGNSWGVTINMDAWPDEATDGNIPTAGNTNDGIQVTSSTGYEDPVWYDVGADFVLAANVAIDAGGSLTITDNVTVRSQEGATLHVHGSLDIPGTAGGGVLLTRNDPDDQWHGIWLYAGANVSMQYTTIEYCTSYSGSGIRADGAWPTLEYCTFRYNNYGIHGLSLTAPTLTTPNTFDSNVMAGIFFTACNSPSIANQVLTGHSANEGALIFRGTDQFHIGTGNTVTGNIWAVTMDMASDPDPASTGNIPLTGNTNNDGVQVLAGNLDDDYLVWPDLGSDYVIPAGVTVGHYGSVIIEAGVELLFDDAVTMNVYGTLECRGEIGSEILFTRRSPSVEWSGLTFNNGSIVVMEHTIIEHVTRNTGIAMRIYDCSTTLHNCTVRDNDYGLYVANGSPWLLNCRIVDNGDYGIYMTGVCTPRFGSGPEDWNDIHSNGTGNYNRQLYNGTEDIAARFVYWGTVDPTEVEQAIGHEPDSVSLGLVHFSSWVSGDHTTLYDNGGTTGIDDGTTPTLPVSFALAQNSPNPFNPATTIHFDLPTTSCVSLHVFDLGGRLVRILANGETMAAGRRAVAWNGRDDAGRQAATGVYFYRLRAGSFDETRRMTLVK